LRLFLFSFFFSSFFSFLLLLLLLRFLCARHARLALELLSIRIATKIKTVEPITAGNKKIHISLFYASLHCHYHQMNERTYTQKLHYLLSSIEEYAYSRNNYSSSRSVTGTILPTRKVC
jgi:hypothetical protein